MGNPCERRLSAPRSIALVAVDERLQALRGTCCIREWRGQHKSNDIELPASINADAVSTYDQGIRGVDAKDRIDCTAQEIAVASIEGSANGGLVGTDRIRATEHLAVDEVSTELGRINLYERPIHIGRITVVGAPSVCSTAVVAAVVELRQADHQMQVVLSVIGQFKDDLTR
jgi:hypothetical protein